MAMNRRNRLVESSTVSWHKPVITLGKSAFPDQDGVDPTRSPARDGPYPGQGRSGIVRVARESTGHVPWTKEDTMTVANVDRAALEAKVKGMYTEVAEN